MPGFDAIYKQTVTLFNRKDVNGVTFWYPSVISGVHLKIDRSIIISTYGEQAQDNAMLHIRYGGGDVIRLADGRAKVYMTPKVFRRSGDPERNITFAFGDNFDFIVSGEFSDELLGCVVKGENITASVSEKRWKCSRFGKTGSYVFTYSGTEWMYGGNPVNLASCGVTVTGTPATNDTITVKYSSAEGPFCDDDYKSGFFNHMNREYDEVFAITNCSKFNLIPHFEITAR